jgi:outer membrane scaffolding protein for murein synthesis (MipA/OmpV family)
VAVPAQSPEWEGAIGLLVDSGQSFMGADRRETRLSPGFYLRSGRFSITNASGFVTRSNDEVVRGLGVELIDGKALKLSLGLRYDGGRRESTSEALRGLGTVRTTVRARLGLRYRFDARWQANAAWMVDAFGRGGGHHGEFSLQREQPWSPTAAWSFGATVSLAGERYLQSWFGVTPEQSQRSGYAVYTPRAGLRDATLFVHWRSQWAPRWVLLGGVSATRLLGPAADSPLVRQASSVAVNGGLAYTF